MTEKQPSAESRVALATFMFAGLKTPKRIAMECRLYELRGQFDKAEENLREYRAVRQGLIQIILDATGPSPSDRADFDS